MPILTLLARSDGGAQHLAWLTSRIDPAKLNDLNPLADLTATLEALAGAPHQLHSRAAALSLEASVVNRVTETTLTIRPLRLKMQNAMTHSMPHSKAD